MKVAAIANKFITDVTPSIHSVRRESLEASVTSLLLGAGLSVTSIGRNIQSDASEKHQIKRSQRLCSNPHLQQERIAIYDAIKVAVICALQGNYRHRCRLSCAVV